MALLLGCGADEPQIRVRLSPDPRVNSEARVAETIDHLRIALDREGGFTRAGGAFVLADIDDDGEDELVYLHPVTGSKLPLLRLVGGASVGSEPLQVSVVGMVGNEIAAVGGSAPARFEPGAGQELTLPLDLRPRYLPPRVVISLPQNGQNNVPAALGLIYVELSKWVRPTSVESNVRVVYVAAGAAEIAVPLALVLEDTTVIELGLREERTAVRARVDRCQLAGGTYRLEVGTGVLDASGNALDQDALSPGNDPFRATFDVTGASSDKPCTGAGGDCKGDADCNAPGVTLYTCATTGPELGRCLPVKTCDRVTCGENNVCMTSDSGPTCVPDCRVRADCKALHFCQPSTGLCVRCDTTQQGCREPCGDLRTGCERGFVCDAPHSRCICPVGADCRHDTTP